MCETASVERMNLPTNKIKNMSTEKTYIHPAAGKITVVYGVDFSGDQGTRIPLHLYRLGADIHRMSPDGQPQGVVALSDWSGPLNGWGINDPIALDGIAVSASNIKEIGA
jgi:hypothetical protein